MKFTIIILTTTVILFSSYAFGGEQYLCIGDKSTGFKFNKMSKEWEYARFNTAKSKYIISKPKDGLSAYVVRKVGEDMVIASCAKDFDDLGFLFCESYFGDTFKFNNKNGRYLYGDLAGYYNFLPGISLEEDALTPAIEIGKCSPF
jgi:hypothetical protein